MFRGRGKRTRPPNGDSPTSTLLQNPQSSNTTTSTNANSPSSMRPMNTTSPISVRSVSSDLSNSASSRRSVRIPKSLGNIRVQQPPSKKPRVSKAVASRKRSKLNDTAGETSGNSSNSAMSNRPKTKKVRIASATRKSAVRQNAQSAARTAADLAAAKQRKINQNYATLINQRNTLPPGYKVKFLNQLLLNTAKKGDKAVKLIRARMREAVTEGLDRSKNLRNLAKKLSPNGQKKFTNDITNNLSVSRYMVIKNAISREIKSEAKEKAAKEKAAKEKAEANKVLNSAIQQRRVNAKKAANEKAAKEKAAKEKAIANAKEVIRARQKKEANAKAAKEKENAKKVLNSAIQQRRANNAKKAAENAKKAKENANKAATAAVAKSSPKIKNMTNENLIRILGSSASIIEKTDKKMPYGKQASRNLLLKTINDIKNPTGSARTEGAKQYLRYLYGAGLSDQRLSAIKQLKTRDVQMRILRQFTALGRMMVAVPNNTLKINLDEDGTLDFLFLMWCDMLHDKTVDDSVSFQNFLNGNAVRTLFPGPGIKFTPTIFIKSLVAAAGAGNIFVFSRDVNNRVVDVKKVLTSPYEADWKEAMTQGDIPIEKTNITNRRPRITKQIIAETAFKLNSIRPRINKKVYISIDQESVGTKEFSTIIDESKNGTVYRLGSIVGYANLFDAGVEMVTKGKQQDRIRSRAWGMMNDPKNVKFMMNYYSPLFQVEINGRGKNRSNNRNTNMSANFGFEEYGNEKGEIKFILNGNEIKPSKGAKTKAQKTRDPSQQLIKFMGDFMQVLTALHAQSFGGGRMLYVPASGDGMFVVIYMYLARKLGLVPKIITSTDDQSLLHFVNLSDVIAGASNESSHQVSGGSHGFSQR